MNKFKNYVYCSYTYDTKFIAKALFVRHSQFNGID